MKQIMSAFLALVLMVSCTATDDTANSSEPVKFYKGLDLSFQSELNSYDINYKNEDGQSISLLDFVKSKGTNLIRLKLWHTPQNGENSLEDVKAYAKIVASKNMGVLLDIHYSDYWADPGTQTPPIAWQQMSFDSLKVAVYDYTKTVVELLDAEGALPEIIQIGNETDSGFLWDYGKVWGNNTSQWDNYADLVAEAIRAIRTVDTERKTQIMLHHSSPENAVFFFSELQTYQLDFDIIGLSYYPQFQTKDLNLLASKLNELANIFNKDLLMVEVAYPFSLEWRDNQTNFVGSLAQIIDDFPPTPQGQKAYLERLNTIIKNIPDQRGIGFCYWAPDWVAFNGNETTSTNGSPWENQCLFDFDHIALPAFEVFSIN